MSRPPDESSTRYGDLTVVCIHPERGMPRGDLESLAREVLSGEACDWTYVGIILSGRDRVHGLNREFLGHDYPTDVLSFTIDRSEDGLEGEVYVDLDTAEENARSFDVPYEVEVARYVVHGLLHLAGHDDDTPSGRDAMQTLEDRYLEAFRTDEVD